MNTVSCSLDQKLLYSTIVKVKADGEKIDDKLKRITWIGIGEQGDETATRRFDMEALREVIFSSGDEQLIEELSKGGITARRYPPERIKSANGRDRIIKIELPSQALRDKLLHHMREEKEGLGGFCEDVSYLTG
ncbi:hypothetical protein COOONC_09312 [Cooperia oncophora]